MHTQANNHRTGDLSDVIYFDFEVLTSKPRCSVEWRLSIARRCSEANRRIGELEEAELKALAAGHKIKVSRTY